MEDNNRDDEYGRRKEGRGEEEVRITREARSERKLLEENERKKKKKKRKKVNYTRRTKGETSNLGEFRERK